MRKVVGIHSAREALKVRSPNEIKEVYFKPNWEKSTSLVSLFELAERKSLTPKILSLKKLDQIHEQHQGVCVYVENDLVFSKDNLEEYALVLILDGLEDPRNFGAIIRTAWLMGVDGIFIPSRRSVSLTPSVIKAASGGVEHVPIEQRDNLYSCIEFLKKEGFWIYDLDHSAKETIWQEKLASRTGFILGNEEKGIRKSLKKIGDKSLSIPQKAEGASYNVSVTAGLILGEYTRQHFPNRFL